jgi:hypothetical protein
MRLNRTVLIGLGGSALGVAVGGLLSRRAAGEGLTPGSLAATAASFLLALLVAVALAALVPPAPVGTGRRPGRAARAAGLLITAIGVALLLTIVLLTWT